MSHTLNHIISRHILWTMYCIMGFFFKFVRISIKLIIACIVNIYSKPLLLLLLYIYIYIYRYFAISRTGKAEFHLYILLTRSECHRLSCTPRTYIPSPTHSPPRLRQCHVFPLRVILRCSLYSYTRTQYTINIIVYILSIVEHAEVFRI